MFKQTYLVHVLTLFTLSGVGSAKPGPGVVVTSTAEYSEARSAGLRQGDLLLSWKRGLSSGTIESPFDLMRVEIEQTPFAPVTLSGRHNSQIQEWQLGPEDWSIDARPNFTSRELQLYFEARRLVERGKLRQARRLWQFFASTSEQRGWMHSWCAWDAANSMSRRRNWNLANNLFAESVTAAPLSSPARVFLLERWARVLERTGDWNRVDTLLTESLSEAERISNDTLVTSWILDELGKVTAWRRDVNRANQLFGRALAIDKRLAPESVITAHTLTDLAAVSLNHGDEKAAEEFLNQAKVLLDKIPSRGSEFAIMDGYLSTIAARRGDLATAKQYLAEAEAIIEPRWSGTILQARLLAADAYLANREGDLDKAEMLLDRAMRIYEADPSNPILGIYLYNEIGVLAFEREDLDTATRNARATDQLLQHIAPVSLDRGGCLMNLGLYAFRQGDLLGAERYFNEAATLLEKLIPNTQEYASALLYLGSLSRRRSEFDRAAEYFARALAILIHVGNKGVEMMDVLEGLAEIERHRGNLQKAQDYYRSALEMAKQYFPSSAHEADLLAGYAQVLDEAKQSDLAAEQYQLAIDDLDGQMGRFGGTEAARSGFRAAYEDVYQHYADLLIRQGKLEKSFDVIERSRARTLLELLAKSKVHLVEQIDNSLFHDYEAIKKQIASELDHKIRLLETGNSDDEIKASDAQIAAHLSKFSEVESRIRDLDPSYADITQPNVATIRNVQNEVLDRDTLLLEYSLGEQRSYVWAVSSDSLSVYQLPERATIERLARTLYAQLASSSRQSARTHTAPQQGASALANVILAPVSNQLRAFSRVAIVADGVLNYVPFAVLPIVHQSGSPLVASHEVINLPSASVLWALRREHAGRQPPRRAVAVLADPVFDPHDPRVTLRTMNANAPQPPAPDPVLGYAASRSILITRQRWAHALGQHHKEAFSFPRLPYSRREAQAIVAVSPPAESLEALDFAANRRLAMSRQLAQYKVVHFATHGLLDTTHPEFSGLLLSLFDEHGEPQVGLLSLQDIYNLYLPVDTVVLSACETALGKEVSGEGMIGLTRGFMYAGASRVVASLWSVNDVATAQLMAAFYRSMEKEGLSPAAALRKAQVGMANDKRWAAPYYWAGFQLHGEWR